MKKSCMEKTSVDAKNTEHPCVRLAIESISVAIAALARDYRKQKKRRKV